ncbi:P-loop containing nucleoside triphosphate hydrolase protein [Saccharata proteae CBS 121410]|uniref:Ribosome-releasing factor 2, mitochondrial n=1 Tax=Saccharata proteae CBS 121410 TaxID=1314787 RepID=A0A9P4LUF7_9PEZI|nr:P-loop containing nucleoside triphosphate hydrolase protein [Saccharata proteae CBS 121410]
MLLGRGWRASSSFHNVTRRRLLHVTALRLGAQAEQQSGLHKTRNIGIIAHIDAGKTTTTERMLYYSGYTRRLGDVDDGSTVTDFLPAERARGITIQSAAISFHWPPEQPQAGNPSGKDTKPTIPRSASSHNVNLIDTPGHADFTFEVLRSLRILDGAVCILDGVAGVEAQTEKVWKQANQYQIPKIIFVNKLDRDGAAFHRTINEIGTKLHVWPALCQIPWWREGDGKLTGVADAVNMLGMHWEEGGDGKAIKVSSLEQLETTNAKLAAELKKARMALVELLSEYDDEMVEKYLEYDEDHLAIPALDITEALRRCTLQHPQKIVPVFAGASFRNIGVQPLLDAVVDLLPSPSERPDAEVKMETTNGGLNDLLSGELIHDASERERGAKKKASSKTSSQSTTVVQKLEACALAFKVVNDAKRGVLVYVRVYSGTLTRSSNIFNTNLGITERAQRLMKMYANDAVDVEEIPAGQIGVIPGLKFARTGDTLIVYTGSNPKVGPPAPLRSLQLRPIAVPPPVFFTSVEPNSLSEERHIADTLALLLREDPSLSVSLDLESGQTHLAGMGELHLEIARDRLINDFKAKATTGKIQIGYREAVTVESGEHTETIEREIAGKTARASCTASVSPLDSSNLPSSSDQQTTLDFDSNRLIIHHPTLTRSGTPVDPEGPELPIELPFPTITAAFQTGVSAALARGPHLHFPVHSAQIDILFSPSTDLSTDTTPQALSIAARQAVFAALKASAAASATVLMEPVMLVTISVNESDLGSVIHDISSARGGQVISLSEDTSDAAASAAAEEDEDLYVDPKRIYAPPDPFGGEGGGASTFGSATADRQRQITARVPLKEMVGYLKHLRSLTGGRGTFVMSVDRFERMGSQRQKIVLGEMTGGY